MLKLHTLATWSQELTQKRPWCWGRLKTGGEGDDTGWDGSMTSPTQWTWVWASSRSWWWTGRPGVLQSMGLQRVGHDWVMEQERKSTWQYQVLSDSLIVYLIVIETLPGTHLFTNAWALETPHVQGRSISCALLDWPCGDDPHPTSENPSKTAGAGVAVRGCPTSVGKGEAPARQ